MVLLIRLVLACPGTAEATVHMSQPTLVLCYIMRSEMEIVIM